ncbi:DUF2000 domain-containing protein [Streptomyces sp. NPDC001665]
MQTKVALVLRDDLSPAHAANAAAVLALSLGGRIPDSLGRDGVDASGGIHAGLNAHPVPVLTAPADELRVLIGRVGAADGVQVVTLNETARRSRDYEDYLTELKDTPADALDHLAVIIHGPRNKVSRLTRHLRLLGAPAAG